MINEDLVLEYQQGNEQALEMLIENNIGIVKKLAFKYSNCNKVVDEEDLKQSGYIGLIKAANKYDFNLENKSNFITYAFYYVEREIQACANGRSSKNINNTKFYKTIGSLNAPIGEDDENGELIDLVDSHSNDIENLDDKLYFDHLRSELEEAMKCSNTLREREILKLHYGWNIDSMTIKEVGEMISIPEQKANQIKIKALRKIKDSIWGRTSGKKYRDEIIGPYECTYRDVEKKFDEELKSLYAM